MRYLGCISNKVANYSYSYKLNQLDGSLIKSKQFSKKQLFSLIYARFMTVYYQCGHVDYFVEDPPYRIQFQVCPR